MVVGEDDILTFEAQPVLFSTNLQYVMCESFKDGGVKVQLLCLVECDVPLHGHSTTFLSVGLPSDWTCVFSLFLLLRLFSPMFKRSSTRGYLVSQFLVMLSTLTPFCCCVRSVVNSVKMCNSPHWWTVNYSVKRFYKEGHLEQRARKDHQVVNILFGFSVSLHPADPLRTT